MKSILELEAMISRLHLTALRFHVHREDGETMVRQRPLAAVRGDAEVADRSTAFFTMVRGFVAICVFCVAEDADRCPSTRQHRTTRRKGRPAPSRTGAPRAQACRRAKRPRARAPGDETRNLPPDPPYVGDWPDNRGRIMPQPSLMRGLRSAKCMPTGRDAPWRLGLEVCVWTVTPPNSLRCHGLEMRAKALLPASQKNNV